MIARALLSVSAMTVLAALTACSNRQPAPLPSGPSPSVEWVSEKVSDQEADRQAIRKLFKTSEKCHTATAITRITGNIYLVSADVNCAAKPEDELKDRQVVEGVARRYYPLDGQPPYWRFENLDDKHLRELQILASQNQ